MQQITFFFSGMQAEPIETSASCPNTVEKSTSSKQTLKTHGKCFTRSKVKKMGVDGIHQKLFITGSVP